MESVSSRARRTPLFALHSSLGAKMVDFHGWELPIQFSGILKEHAAVRSACGLFDVSHMGQVSVEGPGALDFLRRVNSNDPARLGVGDGMYSHMLNERGGIVDDVIVSRLGPERFFVVVNSATTEKDLAWLRAHSGAFKVQIRDLSPELGMVALQGPLAAKVLSRVVPGAEEIKRFGVRETALYSHSCLVARTGYTGEDGFEVIAPEVILSRVWENLAAAGSSFGLLPCGLGARDTLRLEAGYLLYGSDIDDDTTPLEAGYDWVVRFGDRDFIGKRALERQKSAGVSRRLMGVKLLERGVPRSGCPVILAGAKAGTLCSGTFSPTLQAGIGMAYLPAEVVAASPLEVEMHGRRAAAQAVKPPFYKRG